MKKEYESPRLFWISGANIDVIRTSDDLYDDINWTKVY